MSELNLSNTLLDELKATFEKNDPEASDAVTLSQYLAAVLGYVVADITAPEEKLRGLLEQLNDFSMHVFDEEMKKQSAFTPPTQASFGVWRPKNA